ncbi:aminoacyltransferase [Macrococcus hajekii]|uniref:Aminoacyltransferase FemA n=1 Tax=Macrococcus hajekii TaxID=198482 RepID=A0A4R6BLF2_9STAP|nr:aminoacyltransferase [Macrococcus hajekii]TDM02609.1 aminoacyltransferase [Macrococcus hajekii]GGB02427.1 methicillin resistance protein [Macrococcus hajekii]
MIFCELNPDEYEWFVNEHFSHYTQSRVHYDYRAKKSEVYLVGVKENGQLLAACLLTGARAMKLFTYFYSHRGPVMDYNNRELVQFFYTELNRFLKQKKGLFVRVDPHIIVNHRNHDGEVIEHHDLSDFINQMESLGYHHQGFPEGYSMDTQARFLSVLQLEGKSEEQLLKEMEYKTRRNINKTLEMGVQLRDLSIDETDKFFRLFQIAENKHGFTFRDYDYFVRMQKTYGNQCRLVLSYIDLNDYLSRLNDDLKEKTVMLDEASEQLKENPDYRKLKNKVKELEKTVANLNSKIKETEQLKSAEGDILELASALYIHNAHELYYLSSGSNPKYNQFMGPYNMMWQMIQYAKSLGVKTYNFYGVSGIFTEDAPDYGVLKFKKGFNAVVEEYVGDFDKPLRPVLYKLYSKI